jgi:hypothetical protein
VQQKQKLRRLRVGVECRSVRERRKKMRRGKKGRGNRRRNRS